MAKTKAAESKITTGSKKVHEPSEVATFGIGLFGVALLTGWMPDYTTTFFADFAFKGKGFDSASLSHIVEVVFLIAGFVGAICELVIGVLVDRTKTKLGKVKPWVGFGAIPLAIISMLVFVAPNTSSFGLASVWMIVIYCLYTAVSCAVESPSNCFGALCSPNPAERSSAISIASFLRSVGQSGGQVVIIVVGALMKALMGQQQFKNAEGQGIDLIISTAICALGMIIFVMIFFANNKERVPFTSENVSLLESIKLVFTNKNLLMVSLTKVFGFGLWCLWYRITLHSYLSSWFKGIKACTYASYGYRYSSRYTSCKLCTQEVLYKENIYYFLLLRCIGNGYPLLSIKGYRLQFNSYRSIPYSQLLLRHSAR